MSKCFKSIDADKINFYPPIAADYLSNPKKFIDLGLANTEPWSLDFGEIVKQKQVQKIDRVLLSETIQNQYSSIKKLHQSVVSNIDKLKHYDTFTVTTGHQPCIYTGPLYFIYKIASTVKLSKQIANKYPEWNIVPIFWMASEDHDFEEINHIYIKGNKIKWDLQFEGGAIGEISTQNIEKITQDIQSEFPDLSFSSITANQFSQFYKDSKNLSEATRKIVNFLFGEYGVLVIDANDKKLKSKFSHIIIEELETNFVKKSVKAAEQKLQSLGHKIRINPRNINLFYLDEKVRERIEKANSGFKILHLEREYESTQFLSMAKNNPEKFSPNVLMRPLYQETILPNLAYIGGGAEVEYWLQLKPAFDATNIPFPALIFRDSFFILPQKIISKIQQLNLKLEDFFADNDTILSTIIQRKIVDEQIAKFEEAELIHDFEKYISKLKKIDAKLEFSGKATLKKIQRELQKLEKKKLRALKRKSDTLKIDIEKIVSTIKINGAFQERKMNYLEAITLAGKDFIVQIIEQCNPLDGKVKFLIVK